MSALQRNSNNGLKVPGIPTNTFEEITALNKYIADSFAHASETITLTEVVRAWLENQSQCFYCGDTKADPLDTEAICPKCVGGY